MKSQPAFTAGPRAARRPVTLTLGLGAVVLLGAWWMWYTVPAMRSAPLPEFTAPVLGAGDERVVSTQFRGRVVVLNAWASWCIPCRTEVPLLADMARHPGVQLVGLNYRDEELLALKWLGFYGDPFHINLSDPDGKLEKRLGIRGVPQTWIIDTAGRVRWWREGALTEADLEDEIMPLLGRLVAAGRTERADE